MSQAIPVPRYLQAVTQMRSQYAETQAKLAQLATENQQQVRELDQRAEAALAELVAPILPEFTQAALAQAVQLTGYIPLVQNDPLAAMERNYQQLRKQVAEIEEDRRYRDRALLRAPRIGLLTREIAELEDFRAPLNDIVVRCAHERLDRLVEVGYGTPAYNVPFWRMSYYSDWQAADQICERFGKAKTFTELRADYLTARDTVAVYDTKLAKLRQEVRIGESLEHTHDDALQQIEHLPQTFLNNVRGQLASYLRDIDLVAIGDRLALDPQIDGMAKRYLGLRKQAGYLRDSGQHLLQNTSTPVAQTVQKLDRELLKYQRPKFAYASVPAERMTQLTNLQIRRAKSQQQAERYRQTTAVVYSFNNYQYGRLDDDFLWWDLMSYSYAQQYAGSQRVNGNFIAEVSQFRSSHPDYHYQAADLRDSFADAEADAAAASLGADDDRSSSRDIS